VKRSGARTRTVLGLLSLPLASLLSCRTQSHEPSPERLVAAGAPLSSVAAPAPPEAPRFGQCPEGFAAEGTGESLRCRPGWEVIAPKLSDCPLGWKLAPVGVMAPREVCLPAAPTECPAGQRRDLSSAACMPVGGECPGGSEWATPPAGAGEVLYVRTGGTGAGSSGAPFGSIDAAIASASAGAVVLVAAGTYTTTARVERQLTILGACAQATRIVGTAAPLPDVSVDEEFEGALAVHGAGALTLQRVTLSGERTPLTVVGGAKAALSDVIVDDVTPMGIWVSGDGSSITVSQSLFRGGRIAKGRTVAPGINVAYGAHAELRDSEFLRSAGRSIGVLFGASVELADVSVSRVDSELAHASSPIYVSNSASLKAHRLQISGFYGQAITLRESAAELSWVAIDHGMSAGTNAQTFALFADVDSSLACSSCILRDLQGFGVAAKKSHRPSGLHLTDVLIAELAPATDGSGAGISAEGCPTTLERVEVLDVPGIGISIDGSEGSMTDVRAVADGSERDDSGGIGAMHGKYDLRRVSADGLPLGVTGVYTVDQVSARAWAGVRPEGKLVPGIFLQGEGSAQHLHAVESHGTGVTFARGSTVQATGVVVEDIKPIITVDYQMALGITVQTGATVTGSEWVTRRVSGDGLVAVGELTLSDALFADTREAYAGPGVGVVLQRQGNLTRTRIERTFGVGLLASSGSATLSDLAIVQTASERLKGTLGHGLVVVSGELDATRVLVDEARSVGVYTEDSEAMLRDLTVSHVQPNVGFHDGGMGLWSTGPFKVTLQRASVHEVVGTGVGSTQGATVEASDLEVGGVRLGRTLVQDVFGVQVVDGVGDCLILAEGSQGTFTRAILRDCQRSGLFVHKSEAILADVDVRRVPVGLVMEYSELPKYESSSLHFEDVAEATLKDPGYAVPSGPPVQAAGQDDTFGNLIREEAP
jgi:hypothetical protein